MYIFTYILVSFFLLYLYLYLHICRHSKILNHLSLKQLVKQTRGNLSCLSLYLLFCIWVWKLCFKHLWTLVFAARSRADTRRLVLRGKRWICHENISQDRRQITSIFGRLLSKKKTEFEWWYLEQLTVNMVRRYFWEKLFDSSHLFCFTILTSNWDQIVLLAATSNKQQKKTWVRGEMAQTKQRKVALMGFRSVGKSSLAIQFVQVQAECR